MSYVVSRVDGADVDVIAVCRTKDAVRRVVEREITKWSDDYPDELEAAMITARELLERHDYSTRWDCGVASWDFDVKQVEFVE